MGGFKFLVIPLFYFYLSQNHEVIRERALNALPILGTAMTLASGIMALFPALKSYVTVAGRLCGFFQYPNTYAIFLLVCLILSLNCHDKAANERQHYLYDSVCMLGILLSGSRAAFLLTCLFLLYFLMEKRECKLTKQQLMAYGSLSLLLLAVVIAIGYWNGSIQRVLRISSSSSTLLGRILYARDAIPLLVRHPFGMGYYGYYFIQGTIQTGVYSVASVHNDFLQCALDIGIVPACLLVYLAVRNIADKELPHRNRLVLLFLCMHAAFDYDFQFAGISFITILCLKPEPGHPLQLSIKMKTAMLCVGGVLAAGSVQMGMSDLLHIVGEDAISYQIYKGNTLAAINLMEGKENIHEKEALADQILSYNGYAVPAYAVKAQSAYEDGDIEKMILYETKILELSPYGYQNYLDYLRALAVCAYKYMDSGTTQSAKVCVNYMQKISEWLASLKERTSMLGWKIKDKPQILLEPEYQKLIESTYEYVFQ